MRIKHYLIASETNDYRPFITSTTAMACFVVVVWGLRLLVPVSFSFAQGSIDPVDVMNRINAERSSRNIPTLITNGKLVTAAQGKADDMLARSYFSHIDPDGNYVWPRIEAAGYTPYQTLGENLAMDFTSASDMINAWLNSPTHRANMLNTTFQDQGLATSSGLYEPGHNTIIAVSLFGKLAKATTTPPTTSSTQNNSSTPDGKLTIGGDAKLSVTQVSGHNLVDVAVPISGNPTLVTARLVSQSITLLNQKNGFYAGTFTFNLSDDLNGKDITVEARDAAGNKVTSTITVSNIQTIPAGNENVASPTNTGTSIPVSQEAQIIKLLRIIFGILSVIYLAFLVTDWIIIHRQHIQRPGLHLAPQIVVFMIVAFINLFVKF